VQGLQLRAQHLARQALQTLRDHRLVLDDQDAQGTTTVSTHSLPAATEVNLQRSPKASRSRART
jgi:hypothetical protein